jgi:hypothetical protein
MMGISVIMIEDAQAFRGPDLPNQFLVGCPRKAVPFDRTRPHPGSLFLLLSGCVTPNGTAQAEKQPEIGIRYKLSPEPTKTHIRNTHSKLRVSTNTAEHRVIRWCESSEYGSPKR